MRLIDADELVVDAEHMSAFRNNLANITDLEILVNAQETIDPLEIARSVIQYYKDDITRTIGYRLVEIDAVEVVHAYWIGHETTSWRHGSPKRRKYNRCSNCRTASAVRHKICPHCGAHMDGERKEDKQ